MSGNRWALLPLTCFCVEIVPSKKQTNKQQQGKSNQSVMLLKHIPHNTIENDIIHAFKHFQPPKQLSSLLIPKNLYTPSIHFAPKMNFERTSQYLITSCS